MKQLVIMAGGFHPFHAGHLALYRSAVEAFPDADVYVAATADTSERPFPFKFKQQLAQLAGVPRDRFVQVKSPFRAQEIVSKYDPNDTQLIFVRSDKDRDSQPRPGGVKKDGTPSYLQPYTKKEQLPLTQRGYMAYLPTVEFGPGMTSATEIRRAWPGLNDKRKQALIMSLYPKTQKNPQLAKKAQEIFDQVLTPVTENQGWAATLERRHERDMPEKDTKHPLTPLGSDPILSAEKDPGLLNTLRYAQQHYQQHRDDPIMAFMKWVQRSLMHSEEEDRDQDTKIRELERRVHDLVHQVKQQPMSETTIVNDPERGIEVRPEGGMGTWNEVAMVSNLANKFREAAEHLRNKNYDGLYYLLYKSGATRSLVKALVDLERFRSQQGRRRMAPGREIEMDEQIAGTPAVGGMQATYQSRENQPNLDYVEESPIAPRKKSPVR